MDLARVWLLGPSFGARAPLSPKPLGSRGPYKCADNKLQVLDYTVIWEIFIMTFLLVKALFQK